MPLATMRTRSSSRRGSARSSVSIVNWPKRSRATAAVICMSRPPSACVTLLRVRILQLAVLILGRINDHLAVPGLVLVEARALHVLELNHDRPRHGPFAELVEPDLAHDGLEHILVNVGGELVVI